MRKLIGWMGAAALAITLTVIGDSQPVQAQEGDTVELGYVRCDVEGGISFIIGSDRDLECVFESTDKQVVQLFDGKMERFGLDIGYTKSGVMLWTALAGVKFDLSESSIAGEYLQVSAEVALGLGLGANVLLGGNGIKLVPVSITGLEGLNIAAGVGTMTLVPK